MKRAILILVIAVMAVSMFACGTPQQEQTQEPQTEASAVVIANDNNLPSKTEEPKESPTPSPTANDEGTLFEEDAEVIDTSNLKEALKNPLENKGAIIDGVFSVYGEPTNTQGMLMFQASLVSDKTICVAVTMLDENEELSLKSGDNVKISGYISDLYGAADTQGKTVEMPLISASSVSVEKPQATAKAE